MERLTEKTVGCFEYALKEHKAVPGEFGTYEAFFDYSIAVKKLGCYESVCFDGDGNEIVSIDHLRELVQVEQDGRLVVLAFKPVLRPNASDAIYVIDNGEVYDDYVTSALIGLDNDGRLAVVIETFDGRSFRDSDIGKTVFPTCAEAEAALEGGEG